MQSLAAASHGTTHPPMFATCHWYAIICRALCLMSCTLLCTTAVGPRTQACYCCSFAWALLLQCIRYATVTNAFSAVVVDLSAEAVCMEPVCQV